MYPASALELNHNNTHKDLEGYFRFLVASEAWQKGQASMVEPEMWGGVACCTLFVFDNVPNGTVDSTLMNPRQDGDLRICLNWGPRSITSSTCCCTPSLRTCWKSMATGLSSITFTDPKEKKKKNEMVGVIQ